MSIDPTRIKHIVLRTLERHFLFCLVLALYAMSFSDFRSKLKPFLPFSLKQQLQDLVVQ